ncbi:MAG: hypothetical protein KAT46_03245, partial [Deltaproteobacteria bacterium]|nr:hypothetical protein [Deltaproteobacteria bacterium]
MVGNLKKLKVFFSTENSSLPKALDWFLDGALIFLIIFTPLAVGSVGLISRSIMIFVIALIFLAWVIMQLLEGKKIFFPSAIIVSLLVFSFLVLLQLISLPASLVDFLSPKASLLHGALALTEPSSAVFFQLSINPHATLSELMRLLSCVIIFYVIINHYNTKDKILRLITIIVCVGLFISLVALFQKLFWNGKLLWFIPVNSTRSPDMTFFWGPFVNHNHFAGFLLMIIPLSFGLLLSKFEKLRTLPGVTLGKRLVRITESREFLPIVLISLSCIIMTGMLLMTLSRGGFI